MIRRTLHLAVVAAFLPLPLLGCAGEAEPVPAQNEAAPALTGKPWERLPPDSLYGATPVENLSTTEVELDLLGIPAGWNGMRIAALSDFQLGLWEDNEAVANAAVQHAVRQRPDLVVLLGDFIARGQDTAALARVLAPLRGRQVLAVLGDRDIRTDTLAAAITQTLANAGIRVLRNGAVPIIHNQDTAFVAGVDPELAGKPAGDQIWVLSQLGSGRLGLLLSHNPLLASRSPRGRFPGALAGGVFCGRAEVPGTPRLSWLNSEGLPGSVVPEVPRLYRVERMVMFVTCGVGYGFVPIRFGAPPEVAMITLRPIGMGIAPGAAPQDSVSIDTLIERFQRDTTRSDTTGR